MGKVVEFPRKLEWQPVEAWVGTVPNTSLSAKVEKAKDGVVYTWFAWNGPMVVAAGTAVDLDTGKEAARRALEQNSFVIRMNPLTGK